MAVVFEFADPAERRFAELQAVSENTSKHIDFEWEKVQMEHALRIHDIETRALLENYSEDILEALYEKEMEVYTEAEGGILKSIIDWLKGILNAILGIKPEDPDAEVEIPAEPSKIKKLFADAKAAINSFTANLGKDSKAAVVAAAASTAAFGLSLKAVHDAKAVKVKASEAEALKSEGADVVKAAESACEKAGDKDAEGAKELQTSIIAKVKSAVIDPIVSKFSKKKEDGAAPEEKKDGEQNPAEEPKKDGEQKPADDKGNAANAKPDDKKNEQKPADNAGKKDEQKPAENAEAKPAAKVDPKSLPKSYNSFNGAAGAKKTATKVTFTVSPVDSIDQATWNKAQMAKHVVDNSSAFSNIVKDIESKVKFPGKDTEKNMSNKKYIDYLIKNAKSNQFKKVLNDATPALLNKNTGKSIKTIDVSIMESGFDLVEIASDEETVNESVDQVGEFEMAELSFAEEATEETSFEDFINESVEDNEDLAELKKLLDTL